jgi:hypothetical protein
MIYFTPEATETKPWQFCIYHGKKFSEWSDLRPVTLEALIIHIAPLCVKTDEDSGQLPLLLILCERDGVLEKQLAYDREVEGYKNLVKELMTLRIR